MPPTLPFSKSYLTFLLKGTLCQTHPSAWIVAFSPWYENADEKETFADAVIVMKSARVVAALTDLSTRSFSPSPLQQQQAQQKREKKNSPSPSRKQEQQQQRRSPPSKPSSSSLLTNTVPAFYDDLVKNDANSNISNTSLSPQTPVATSKPTTALQQQPQNENNRFLSHYNFGRSNPNSPAPKEQNAAPQPIPLLTTSNTNILQENINNISATSQLVQQVRQLENLVLTLQNSLKKSQDENQHLRMQNLTLSSQLGEAESKANRCEGIVTALQQHGKFSLNNNVQVQQQQQQQQPVVTAPIVTTTTTSVVAAAPTAPPPPTSSSSSAARKLNNRQQSQLISPSWIELPSTANNIISSNPGVSSSLQHQYYNQQQQQNHYSNGVSGATTPQQQELSPGARNRSTSLQSANENYQNNINNNMNDHYYLHNNSHNYIPSDVWSRSGRNPQKQNHTRTLSTESGNHVVVVGYNFELTQDEERAVRKEMEKRGIIRN
jgi:hypothetical protein